jgi:DUF1680 family protein
MAGLLAYHEISSDDESLVAAKRMAHRIMADFGPGKRFVHDTGPHSGMASSAVLQPMVDLYMRTGDRDFLAFARWLVDVDWEAPGGSAIVSTIERGDGVAGVANGKAAEMLICLRGLLWLHRATGEERYGRVVQRAWADIAASHLYPTGSASEGERFRRAGDEASKPFRSGETCVTVTWLDLSSDLWLFTGDGRYFDAVEQALYNHLTGAQSPDGRAWAYYVGLRDAKRYRWHTDPDCCPTRGSRALAAIPRAALATAVDGISINFYESYSGHVDVPGVGRVDVQVESDFPVDGNVDLRITLARPARFVMRFRVPTWAVSFAMAVNDDLAAATEATDGYVAIARDWMSGDSVTVRIGMSPVVFTDTASDRNLMAVAHGPVVYALEGNAASKLNGEFEAPASLLDATSQQPPRSIWAYSPRYLALGVIEDEVHLDTLKPFSEAGNFHPESFKDGIWPNTEPPIDPTYSVWMGGFEGRLSRAAS